MRRLWFIALLLCLAPPAGAESLLMVRSRQAFPEAMLTLQQSIRDHGYTVSRVQRVDIGLTQMGYETDKYRVVFFGKLEELRTVTANSPALLPYLPMNISIFAEGEQTILVAIDPVRYMDLVGDDDATAVILARCASDVRSIFEDVRRAE